MAYDYEKAFALTDNPFSPIQPLPGLNMLAVQNALDSNPLLIETEPALEKLFSPNAGPFGTYLENFKRFARREGYHDAPPRAGIKSHIVSIWGYEGTGKSTLAQVFIKWLKTCTPRTGKWFIHEEWSRLKLTEVQRQLDRIDEEHRAIVAAATANSHVCIVADNLISGVLERILELYDQLTRDRIVFLFLISSDRQLYPQLSGQSKRSINPFRMRALSEEDAVAFIKHRINEFRVPRENRPPWLEDDSLFPFNEDDIRSAFARGIFYQDADTVALRDFSVMVNKMLTRKLDAMDDDFDITQNTEAEVRAYMIWLAEAYNELVAA